MTSRRICRSAIPILALVLGVGAPAAAQGVALQVSHLFDDGGWTAYSAGWSRSLFGALGTQLGGVYLRRPDSSERLFGLTLDASLFRGGRPGVYAIGGLGGGIGTGSAESWWRSWSAGVGYEFLPLSFLSLGVEGRYREMLPARRSGPELAIRIGTVFGSRGDPAPLPVASAPASVQREPAESAGATEPALPPATAASRGSVVERSDADAVARDVIRIAEGEIGTRYQLGGTGTAGDGFDCSGLIQYAYARYGVELPRRSVDQARRGREIGRRPEALRPGDILTFSTSGGRAVTHVGLYMGDGRFIHSASKGVQISRLSGDDPRGRWWHRRWVGSRRILEVGDER